MAIGPRAVAFAALLRLANGAIPECAAKNVGYVDPAVPVVNGGIEVADAGACQQVCGNMPGCKAFTYYVNSGGCWLQGMSGSLPAAQPIQGVYSGPSSCGQNATGSDTETLGQQLAGSIAAALPNVSAISADASAATAGAAAGAAAALASTAAAAGAAVPAALASPVTSVMNLSGVPAAASAALAGGAAALAGTAADAAAAVPAALASPVTSVVNMSGAPAAASAALAGGAALAGTAAAAVPAALASPVTSIMNLTGVPAAASAALAGGAAAVAGAAADAAAAVPAVTLPPALVAPLNLTNLSGVPAAASAAIAGGVAAVAGTAAEAAGAVDNATREAGAAAAAAGAAVTDAAADAAAAAAEAANISMPTPPGAAWGALPGNASEAAGNESEPAAGNLTGNLTDAGDGAEGKRSGFAWLGVLLAALALAACMIFGHQYFIGEGKQKMRKVPTAQTRGMADLESHAEAQEQAAPLVMGAAPSPGPLLAVAPGAHMPPPAGSFLQAPVLNSAGPLVFPPQAGFAGAPVSLSASGRYAAPLQYMAAPHAAPAPHVAYQRMAPVEPMGMGPQALFDRLDRNHDGVLTREEFERLGR